MFYVTTPIYYVNAQPHIGHAYTTILADVLRRYHGAFGEETYFLTGVDEHGQKVQEAADTRGMTPQQHVDDMEVHFRELWPELHISNDDFIRTTEPRHKEVVQTILQRMWDAGEIYPAEYSGWYSPSVERYWTEKDLVDGRCPESGQEVHHIEEKNYFFRMSKYQEPLVQYIHDHPDFIRPESRRNEVLGFLKKPLRDLCISRPTSRLSWGIPLPFDADFVTYVWFDALLNYASAVGLTTDDARFDQHWAGAHHLIGKDILTTHAVYWPTMLMGAGLPMPRSIVATGWWLTDNTKMSKSLGNVVSPLDLKDKYGVDVLRYFLCREMSIGQDANFSEEALVRRNNSDLANDLGNLVNRTVRMISRYFDGVIQPMGALQDIDRELADAVAPLTARVRELVGEFRLNQCVEEILQFVRAFNKYIDTTRPFSLIKADPARAGAVLTVVLEGARVAANLLHPIMPVKMEELLRVIGAGAPVERLDALAFGGLPAGAMVRTGEPVFPRHEFKVEAADAPKEPAPAKLKDEAKAAPAPAKEAPADAPTEGKAEIEFDDFMKLDLRIAEIIRVEPLKKADKLWHLTVRLGDEERSILAGVKEHFTAEELVGRKVPIVANLKPRKIRGVMSQGMMLVAEDDEGLALLSPGRDVPSGSAIS